MLNHDIDSMFLATIPAVIWVDSVGRKPVLVSGAFLMAACHLIVAILTGLYEDSWDKYVLDFVILSAVLIARILIGTRRRAGLLAR